MADHPHHGHRKRLRERARKEGLDSFEDHQVLELLLTYLLPYKDVNPLAHELIDKFGNLAKVLEADETSLAKVKGLGAVTANFLAMLPQILNCYEKQKVQKNAILFKPIETYEYVRKLFVGKTVEEIYLISLTPKSQVIRVDKLSSGTTSEAGIAMRSILETVSRTKSNNYIIAHNHPKGASTPSINDNNFTKALVVMLAINNIYLVDHMIIGEAKDDFYSYRQSGLIDAFRKEVEPLVTAKISQNEAIYDYEVKDDQE